MPFVIDPPPAPPLPAPKDDGADLWEVLYEAFGYMRDFDPDNGYALRKLCEAWCAPIQRPHDVVRERADQPAPFSVLFDPDQCPAWLLPYAVQWVGVVPTPEMSEAQLREEFRQPAGWARGRPESIRTAIRRTLTGEQRVILKAQTPEVGHHYIRVLLSECPDPARTAAVARAAVPAWEALDFAAIAGVSLADLEAGWPESLEELEGAFTSLADIEDTLPDELPE